MLNILKHKKLPAFVWLFWLVLNFSTAHAAQEETARQVVEGFQAELIAIMKQGKELGFKGRYDRLEIAIAKSHDLNKITRVVVGKEWAKLSNEQQQKLVDVFSKLSIASYAYNFKDFSGESFKFDSEDETTRGGAVIHAYLLIPSEKDVKFDYMLKKKGDSWRIINIIADGVSDLALKRSEYTNILEHDGFDALITKINEKIDHYAKQ